eukprot:TRINITY_DN659_c0_g1_i3.p1 TRINITY_DN659_c0_g1~~TRINITY_DN659_c0_g1_i3.p1  ORF type:complete len:322 (+),score=26.84 TRINITY_DN659_c0_g1_i3:209-1174(+)
MLSSLYDNFLSFLCLITLFLVASYILPLVLVAFVWKEQNLKQKYKAKWAAVTGGSSGLGKALAEKLCRQGLNVVIIAKEDRFLEDTQKELQQKFQTLEIRAIGVDLTKRTDTYDYLTIIKKQTQDIDVQILFSNAGYTVVKAFPSMSLGEVETQIECNLTSHVRISHYFMRQMALKKLKGGITFTSSTVAFFPSPFSALYSCEKAFLQQLAACLYTEGKKWGIDVLAVMLGPMQTRFYDNVPKLNALNFFNLFLVPPEVYASQMFKALGRLTWCDSGLLTYGLRLFTKIVDLNLLSWITAFSFPYTPDFKNFPDLHAVKED